MQLPNWYQVKKVLLYPYTRYRRNHENLEPGFLRSAMELHYYRPAFYRWLRGVSTQPDLLYEAYIAESGVILDVGAYTGEWAQEMASRYAATIHAFEPDPRNFRQLQKRFSSHASVATHEYGLGDKTETLPMALSHMGSNLYDSGSTGEMGNRADVQIRHIAEVWQALKLNNVDLMKINIEGAEFPLLEEMQRRKLLAVPNSYLIQFHEWHPGAHRRRRKIRRALSNTHTLEWDYHFVWEKWVRKPP